MQQILGIPSMEKSDNGDYKFPAEYVGKMFKLGSKYIYFTERTNEEVSIELIKYITEIVKEEFDEVYIKKSELDTINKIQKRAEEKSQTPEDVRKIINSELNVVYENYGSVIKNLVEQKAKELSTVNENSIKKLIESKAEEIANNINENAKKIDPLSLMIYKKMGMDIKDIIDLAKSGLV